MARGLGLGLSIVERIARVLNHKVEVDSTVDRGSHFSIEVPLASSDTAARAAAPACPTSIAGSSTGIEVVCIDNDVAILNGMELVLDRLGLPRAQGAGPRDWRSRRSTSPGLRRASS